MADTELMSLGELSDGAVRPWYLRDDDRRTRLVYGAGAVVVALFGLIFSFLLGSVDGGSQGEPSSLGFYTRSNSN